MSLAERRYAIPQKHEDKHAEVSWTFGDVYSTLRDSIQPHDLTERGVERFFNIYSDSIQDVMVEAGWAAMESLLRVYLGEMQLYFVRMTRHRKDKAEPYSKQMFLFCCTLDFTDDAVDPAKSILECFAAFDSEQTINVKPTPGKWSKPELSWFVPIDNRSKPDLRYLWEPIRNTDDLTPHEVAELYDACYKAEAKK